MTIISLSTFRGVNDCEPLPLGQVVSYEDMANPRREAAVVSATPERYGQRVVRLDARSESHVTRNIIDGPGGWRLVDRVLSVDEVERLIARRDAVCAEQNRQRDEELAAARQREADGKAWLADHQPSWAKAVLVAELHVDVSDSQTDYFSSRVERTVLLAWSKHTRDLFSEMRKAAGRLEETAHLVDAPDSAEHREKYSMGAGYYLTTGGRYRGWRVEKWRLPSYNLPAIAADPEARQLLETEGGAK